MNLTVITPPAEEPIDLSDLSLLKQHLHLESSYALEDDLLAAFVTAAREKAEEIARRAFVTQTLKLTLDEFPSESVIKLPRPPLASVESIYYTPESGSAVEFTDFVVDTTSEPGRIALAPSASWPSDDLTPLSGVAITYTAGYGAASAVPQLYKQAILMIVAHWYETRETTVPNAIGSVNVPFGAKVLLGGDKGWY